MKEDLTTINGPTVRYVPRITWERTNFESHTTQTQFLSSITPDGNGKVKECWVCLGLRGTGGKEREGKKE